MHAYSKARAAPLLIPKGAITLSEDRANADARAPNYFSGSLFAVAAAIVVRVAAVVADVAAPVVVVVPVADVAVVVLCIS